MRLMGIAYEMTLISLRVVDRGDIVNNVVAQKLIEIAKAGEERPRAVVRSRVATMGSSHRTCLPAHISR